MKKKALNKNIIRSTTNSWARFFSIMLLIALGSFALIGLSVTGPDMRTTGENYFKKYKTADVTIISDYGFSNTEITALAKNNNILNVEYIYLKDVIVENSTTSFRIFSNPQKLSMYELVRGKMPIKDNEIAIDISNENTYKIGDTITFNEKASNSGTKTLKHHTFKITGFINSSEILSTLNRGQTTVGTGALECYAIVNSEAFGSDVYMMAKIVFKDTQNLDPYSNEYNEKIIKNKKELEEILEDVKDVRYSLIKSEYQSKIDDAISKLINAKQELLDAKNSLEEANTKISNAKIDISLNENKLDIANKKIKEAESLLSSKKNEFNLKKEELKVSKEKLDDAQNAISDSENKLSTAKQQIDSSESLISDKQHELIKNAEALNNMQSELDLNKQELEKNKNILEDAKNKYELGIKNLNDNILTINLILENNNLTDDEKNAYQIQLQALNKQLTSLENEYHNFLINTYNSNIANINLGMEELEAKQEQLNSSKELLESYKLELSNSIKALNAKKSEYDKAVIELDRVKEIYNQNITEYNNALEIMKAAETQLIVSESESSSKKNEYSSGVKTLEETKKELEKKEEEYYSKLEEYNSKLPDATSEIENGENNLKEAQEKIDYLESPVYEVDNRRETPGGEGYKIYETVSNIIDSLADIFPWFMYFVAALVTLTTMTRFVDEERINMGTLKALGYNDKDIIKKFVSYGFLSAMIGTILGVTLGHILIPYIVYNAYGYGFTIPKIEIHFYLTETILACVLAMLCSVVPAYIVAKNNLKEKPASLLLPKAPANGSKIFLERIKFIWKKLDFTKKVTARNIFRYKKRMLMTIFGVAGSCAILFTGFAVQNSISTINDKQFQDIIKYNIIVALNSDSKNEEIEKFNTLLHSDSINGNSSVYFEEVSKETGKNNDRQEIKLLVPEKEDDFRDYLDLHTRKERNEISLNGNGVIISERLAASMNVNVGDSFTFEDSKGITHEVKVLSICEMYAGHFIFMSKTEYEKIFNTNFETNAYMLLLKDSSIEYTEKVSGEFMELTATKSIVQNTTVYNMVNTIVKSLNKIMLVLIILASLLSIVIIFNLTNINVAERIRELSTIKVLGFRDKEVTMYIYKETIILSQIGIIIGWLFGILLHKYILTVVPPDEVMFDPSLWFGAFLISFVVINVVTFVFKFYVHKKLMNVDMVEALKSIE